MNCALRVSEWPTASFLAIYIAIKLKKDVSNCSSKVKKIESLLSGTRIDCMTIEMYELLFISYRRG